ncbi:MAG: hypothetical protein IKO77_00635 [Bacteroidales bacterium]|nr:hypothetical protein [Bacteroidales bacterium]
MKNFRVIILVVALVALIPSAYWLLDRYGLKSEKAAIAAVESSEAQQQQQQSPEAEAQQPEAPAHFEDIVVPEGHGRQVSDIQAPPAVDNQMSRSGYMTFVFIVFGLLAVALIFSMLSGNVVAGSLMGMTLRILLGTLAVFGIGYLIVRLTMGVVGIIWYFFAPLLVLALFLYFYNRGRNNARRKAAATSVRKSAADNAAARYDFMVLFASLIVMLVWTIVTWISGAPSHYLVVPMAAVCISILLLKFTRWRIWPLLAVLTVVLYTLLYCVPASFNPAAGWFWKAMVLTVLYLGLAVPMSNLYLRRQQ